MKNQILGKPPHKEAFSMKTGSFNVMVKARKDDDEVKTRFCKGAYETFEEAYKKGRELLVGHDEVWIWDLSELGQTKETQVK